MNRRGFLGSLAALAAVPVVAKAAPPAAPVLTYPPLNDPDYWFELSTAHADDINRIYRERCGRDATPNELQYWQP